MQTAKGKKPQGFCAEEFQEYMRQVVTPTLKAKAEEVFPNLPQSEAYEQLKRDLDWDGQEFGPCYMVGMDRDRRHSWVDFKHYREERANTGRGNKRDRRELEYGQGDHIQFQERQVIPSASRTPDTIQQPVELCIGWIKRRARKLLRKKTKLRFEDIRDAIEQACKELQEAGHIKSFWDHGTKAIAVFAATKKQKVKVSVKGVERTFIGTHGGWVPKQVSG